MKNQNLDLRSVNLSPLFAAGDRLEKALSSLEASLQALDRRRTYSGAMMFMQAGIAAVELEEELKKLGCGKNHPQPDYGLSGPTEKMIAVHALWEASIAIRSDNLFWREGEIGQLPDLSQYLAMIKLAVDVFPRPLPLVKADATSITKEGIFSSSENSFTQKGDYWRVAFDGIVTMPESG